MSKDIVAFKILRINDYCSCGYDTDIVLSGFTLSGRLNDYWGTYELFQQNYDEKIENPEGFDILIYNREKLISLVEINNDKKLGDDVDFFLKELLKSQLKTVYIKIIE